MCPRFFLVYDTSVFAGGAIQGHHGHLVDGVDFLLERSSDLSNSGGFKRRTVQKLPSKSTLSSGTVCFVMVL